MLSLFVTPTHPQHLSRCHIIRVSVIWPIDTFLYLTFRQERSDIVDVVGKGIKGPYKGSMYGTNPPPLFTGFTQPSSRTSLPLHNLPIQTSEEPQWYLRPMLQAYSGRRTPERQCRPPASWEIDKLLLLHSMISKTVFNVDPASYVINSRRSILPVDTAPFNTLCLMWSSSLSSASLSK